MNTIYYMWNFKPNEPRPIPKNAINNNKKFILNSQTITPNVIEKLLIGNTEFPELYGLYNNINHWVIKADVGRLLLIYYNGGFYSDVDCFMKKNIVNKENDVSLFIEKICNSPNELGARENKENLVRIANYFFGTSSIKNPFFKDAIEECIRRLKLLQHENSLSQQDILWVCGPDVITTVYHNNKDKDKYNITLYDTEFLDHKCYGSWRK